jgi:hypothetical protein
MQTNFYALFINDFLNKGVGVSVINSYINSFNLEIMQESLIVWVE